MSSASPEFHVLDKVCALWACRRCGREQPAIADFKWLACFRAVMVAVLLSGCAVGEFHRGDLMVRGVFFQTRVKVCQASAPVADSTTVEPADTCIRVEVGSHSDSWTGLFATFISTAGTAAGAYFVAH